jgi:hypothetical protein
MPDGLTLSQHNVMAAGTAYVRRDLQFKPAAFSDISVYGDNVSHVLFCVRCCVSAFAAFATRS